MTAKPAISDIPATHAPLASPDIIQTSETAVTALQDTIAEYAVELRRRAKAGNINAKDGALVASLATASAKLASEQREQSRELHLSLQSDEDIVKLVIDSVVALGPRGRTILYTVLHRLDATEPTTTTTLTHSGAAGPTSDIGV